VRQAAYWSAFAGAMGHTYGHLSIWSMHNPAAPPAPGLPAEAMLLTWDKALDRPGSQATATRWHNCRPASRSPSASGRIRAPTSVVAWWFNPRNGSAEKIGEFDAAISERHFAPPGKTGRGHDIVLVIDDAIQNFNAPGAWASK
jgi:hypothetical protein